MFSSIPLDDITMYHNFAYIMEFTRTFLRFVQEATSAVLPLAQTVKMLLRISYFKVCLNCKNSTWKV